MFNNLFHGRISRGNFAVAATFLLPVFLAVVFLLQMFFEKGLISQSFLAIVSNLFFWSLFVFSISLSVRRLHDIEKSGWYILLHAIPLVNIIFAFWLLFKTSDVQTNQYGEPPNTKIGYKNILGIK